jgi:hypothetical protein
VHRSFVVEFPVYCVSGDPEADCAAEKDETTKVKHTGYRQRTRAKALASEEGRQPWRVVNGRTIAIEGVKLEVFGVGDGAERRWAEEIQLGPSSLKDSAESP